MSPAMKPVFSSTVESVGHDSETSELYVTWKGGRTSIYEGVPAKVAADAQNSWSVGQAVREIRDQYSHRYKG